MFSIRSLYIDVFSDFGRGGKTMEKKRNLTLQFGQSGNSMLWHQRM